MISLQPFMDSLSLDQYGFWILCGLMGLLLFCVVILLILKIIRNARDLGPKTTNNSKSDVKKGSASLKNASKEEKKPAMQKEDDSLEEKSSDILSSLLDKSDKDLSHRIDEEGSSADTPKIAILEGEVANTHHLIHVADELVSIKGSEPEEDKKKEKPGKLKTASTKRSLRKAKKALKHKSTKLRVPKTVQDTIPYLAVYPDDGIIETRPGIFTRSYLLGDVNYQIAKDEEQFEMFQKYGQLLNSFDSNVNFQITINQKNINMDEFEAKAMLPLQGDALDELRIERNEMLKKKITEGKNHLVKEKYLTISLEADSLEDAQTSFLRYDAEIAANVKKIGQASAIPMTSAQRLEVLHDIYNIGEEGTFGNNMLCKKQEDGSTVYVFDQEKFRFDIMRRMGLTTKDMIGPSSFKFSGDYGMLGDTYFRALFMSRVPSFLTDNVLAELTNTECNMITSLHLQAIDGEKAQKLIRNQITNINASVVAQQKKASKSGYSVDLISPELRDAANESSELLDDINNKNQKLFYVTLVIVHFADNKTQLDQDTKTIQSIGRKMMCGIKKLSQQQENGLNTALPLAYNQTAIKRTLTSESSAIFMPFVNQELNDSNGMYYGNNAVSHNLIIFDRRARKNGNGMIIGAPGTGKSFSAKQEILNVLLSTEDTVVVIDPEGEYYPMTQLPGGQEIGEVVRIAAGADAHINPFDIDLSEYSDSKDDPMAMKSDFIVSLCETIVGDRYGLASQQRSIIDRCVKMAYGPYLSSRDPKTGKYDQSRLPTLVDFYHLLRQQNGLDAMQLADGLELYIVGSLNIFAHQTNVEYSKRFVVFDIKDVGTTMKPMALLVVLDNIWNRLVAGRKEGRYTWFYIDEMHLLFKVDASAEFLKSLYKRARKYFGIPTGITQNVSDLLEHDIAKTMLYNCEFVQMLSQSAPDRAQLAEHLNISPTQLGFITNSNPGEGLIYDGRVIVPFINKLPKETKQYMALTTKPSEVREREALAKQAEEEKTAETK